MHRLQTHYYNFERTHQKPLMVEQQSSPPRVLTELYLDHSTFTLLRHWNHDGNVSQFALVQRRETESRRMCHVSEQIKDGQQRNHSSQTPPVRQTVNMDSLPALDPLPWLQLRFTGTFPGKPQGLVFLYRINRNHPPHLDRRQSCLGSLKIKESQRVHIVLQQGKESWG